MSKLHTWVHLAPKVSLPPQPCSHRLRPHPSHGIFPEVCNPQTPPVSVCAHALPTPTQWTPIYTFNVKASATSPRRASRVPMSTQCSGDTSSSLLNHLSQWFSFLTFAPRLWHSARHTLLCLIYVQCVGAIRVINPAFLNQLSAKPTSHFSGLKKKKIHLYSLFEILPLESHFFEAFSFSRTVYLNAKCPEIRSVLKVAVI